jgi:hypothetical protein
MWRLVLSLLPLLVCSSAFAESDRRNTDCNWPEEAAVPLDLRNREEHRHLKADAELAEDLAIRFADKHEGYNPGYVKARNQCMAALFSMVAKNHDVTVEQLREVLVERPVSFDAVVLLCFTPIYFLLASLLTKLLSRRFPLQEGLPSLLVFILAAIFASFLGVLLLEILAFAPEVMRLGNNHLSYRANRIPWAHHRLPLFVGGFILYLLAAAHRYRKTVRDTKERSNALVA